MNTRKMTNTKKLTIANPENIAKMLGQKEVELMQV